MIPKKIFYFWGNRNMSWMRYLTLRSFRILNPDRGITLYTSDCDITAKPWQDNVEQDFFKYHGPDYTNMLKELDIEIVPWNLIDVCASQLSNLLKWTKLHEYGGVYADMDILWIRPFDSLYREMCTDDTAISVTKYLSIGLLGSVKGNRMYSDILACAKDVEEIHQYQCMGVRAIYKLLYGTKVFQADETINFSYLANRDILQDLKDRWPDLKIFNIPFGIIYPFGCLEMPKVFDENYTLPEHVIGLHWYAGSPLSQFWNNILQPNTVDQYENTFTRYARHYVD